MTILRHLADNLQMVRHDGINAIKYVTVDGDLDAPGTWKLQAYVEMPGWKGFGEVATLVVSPPL